MKSQANLPAAEAVEIGKLVDYAEAAIVSRTLVENAGGTITLFAFDAGQALSEHSAPFDAIAQVVDGLAEITIAGEAVSAPAGCLVVMPAGMPHAVRAPRQMKMLLTMLRASSGDFRCG
jgi:quercetin dioxygenase-like cupin family protein